MAGPWISLGFPATIAGRIVAGRRKSHPQRMLDLRANEGTILRYLPTSFILVYYVNPTPALL